MQCKCNSELPKKLEGMVIKEKKALKATNLNVSLTCTETGLDARTTSTFELQLEGAKKPVKQEVLHSFCPFCGVAAVKEEKKKKG